MEIGVRKSILLVMDSLGVGELPDAANFNSRGANTLAHIAESLPQGLELPNLSQMGLGNLTYARGLPRFAETTGFFGKARLRSGGNDSLSGHWEMAGLSIVEGFTSFQNGPSDVLLAEAEKLAGTKFLVFRVGEEHDPTVDIMSQYLVEHRITKQPILVCSGSSIFQIAAHPQVMPLEQLFTILKNLSPLAKKFNIAKLSAIPIAGEPGNVQFLSEDQQEIHLPPVQPTLFDMLIARGIPVIGVGRIRDMFSGLGLTDTMPADNNHEVISTVMQLLRDSQVNREGQAVIVANLYDFDKYYSHLRDPIGYANALAEFDDMLPRLKRAMENEDVLYLTADHGGDPTFPGNNHTREHVPILVFSRMIQPQKNASLGVRKTLADIAQTVAESYDLGAHYAADSFWGDIVAHM